MLNHFSAETARCAARSASSYSSLNPHMANCSSSCWCLSTASQTSLVNCSFVKLTLLLCNFSKVYQMHQVACLPFVEVSLSCTSAPFFCEHSHSSKTLGNSVQLKTPQLKHLNPVAWRIPSLTAECRASSPSVMKPFPFSARLGVFEATA